MLEFIIKFVCLVGLPLFFIAGLLYPLVTAWTHEYMDPELREMKRARREAKLAREARSKSKTSRVQK